MGRIYALILLALAALAPELPAADHNPESDVRSANLRYDAALIAADAAVLDSLYLPEFTYIGPNGVVRSKAEQIQALTSGSVDILEGKSEEVLVRMHGDTAIVTGRFSGRVRVNGEEFSFHERYSTVWIRQGNWWRLALEHGTVIKAD